MRKLVSLFSVLLLFCMGAFAGPVDQSEALKIAGNFMGSGSNLKINYKSSYKIARANQAEQNLFYVINRGDNQGYVVVAADNRVMPILAYSDKGSLTEEDIQNHPSIKWLYEEYGNQIKWAINNLPDVPSDEYRKVSAARAANYEVEISPLLEVSNDRWTRLSSPISWGQSWPFNLYAPNYRYNGYSYPTVAGCVATAICTVMRWHKWPRKATGSVSYYWKGNYMALNFDGNGSENASYDWSQMPSGVDSYGRDRSTGRKLSDVQADNIGRLLRDIGYAVQMDYNPASFGGSGAYVFNAPRVLMNNFGYRNTVRFLERNNYYQADWMKNIHDELRDYGPVVYAGFSSGGGHCFVLDGYASNGYVHVDWGWNYSSNGWHLLNVLQPGTEGIGGGSGGYKSSQQMLRYLYPDRDNDPDPEPNPNPNPEPDEEENGSSLYIYSKATQSQLAQANSQPVTITVGNNNKTASYSGRLAVAIYQDGDQYSTIVGTTNALIGANSAKNVTFYANLANVKAGNYKLTVNYAYGSTYKAIDAEAGSVTIGNIDPEPDPQPEPIVEKGPELYSVQKVVEYVTKGTNTKITMTIANEGDAAYNGKLMLYALAEGSNDVNEAVLISEGNAKIDKSQRVTFSFYTNDDFKKLEAGKYYLISGYMLDGEEQAVKINSDEQVWKIGELTINEPENEEEEEVVNDIKLQTVFFYQGGTYLGSDNSTILTSNSNFTARVYLRSMTGFEGRVKFYVTDTQYGTKSLNSNLGITKTINLAANSNGYVDITFPTRYFTKNRYYVNILYNTGGSQWLYYPTDVVPFYVNNAAGEYEGNDGNPTMGPTFDFDVLPNVNNNFQSIGYKAEGSEIINGNTTGINEVGMSGDFSLMPSVATSDITITSAVDCSASIFNSQGKLFAKFNLKVGDNTVSVANLTSGVYFVKINDVTLKFIKK
ncbi:MAG: C10 family peptidase [Prevotella sp.]|uniref:C10 family peptidase n=1 Tax=Prevotella sp. TaxID=59823 RepID=UPI002A2A18E3|nr:C10 family peptidase [Prevotella sp.]MDD7318480.1 C10 family peptidase [Prevotellaceae bacterium]MDY4020169.1 C10 family peptidase [Prevotella sp.]